MAEENLALSNRWLPDLDSGKYSLEIEQTAPGLAGFETARAQLEFSVMSNRFAMVNDAVYSVYPPRNTVGMYNNILPHIVLHDAGFPWEITKKTASGVVMPWVMLLLLDESEFLPPTVMTLQHAINPPENIFFPHTTLTESEDPNSACLALDLDAALFKEIYPPDEDRPYMAHVRSVNLDDKVTDPLVTGAHFSCLVSNRYAKEPSAGFDQFIAHTAFVVSLDGYEKGVDYDNYQYIRLIALHSWTFTNQARPFNFEALMKNMRVSSLRQPKTSNDGSVNELLKMGYVPIPHNLRDGGGTVSWYKGPLLPCLPQKESERPVSASDERLKYDPETGMFDVGYACAWQLGQMLTRQNIFISKKLMRWRIEHKFKAAKEQNNRLFAGADSVDAIAGNLISSIAKIDYTGFAGTPYETFVKKLAEEMKNGQQ
jgi:hypothetical protein